MADDPSPTRLSARELAVLCGVSERTVRFYVEEGLLPPPLSRGRGAHYGEDHLNRLKLIRAMQQAGNDLETIGEYLAELEKELAASGASFESALAIWNGRSEQAVWREAARKRWIAPEALHRYRVAEGIELLVEAGAAPSPGRMRELLRMLREALEAGE